MNIRHPHARRGGDAAFPTGVLVDKNGIVRWIYEAEFGHMRMTPRDLLDALERLTLEEQNRELRRARSVGRVVRQVFMMDKPDDLGLAIEVLQEELRNLGLRFSVCGIGIIESDGGKVRTYSATGRGNLATREMSVDETPEVQGFIDAWEKKEVHAFRFGDAGDSSEWRWVVSVPFSHGALFVGSTIADDIDEPDSDHVAALTEFADAISVAYRRFADFRELRETQLQLIQSEKMASLGQLVSGVAHELNTPMGAIQSNTQTERKTLERLLESLDGTAHEKLASAIAVLRDMSGVNEAAIRRMAHIVGNLRKFARLDESEWKSADVREGLEETLALVEHQTKGRIEVERSYGDVPPLSCYPGQLNQVFMNLIVNAIQAINGTGRIRVEAFREREDIVVRVTDDGAGIAKGDLARIFDPGFTTKGVGVGTGLGLSICYRIVQNHDGRITAESEPGRGSTFTVAIPLGAEPPRERTREASAYSSS